ncbi:MAG: DUF1572 family protein [Ferruginibacter sp.]
MNVEENYIVFAIKQFQTYKALAEKAFVQVKDEQLFSQPNEESNSIGMIVQHMAGNMLSRWTDFMTTDGEKEWRTRDEEFEPVQHSKIAVYLLWEKGWQCLFDALEGLSPAELHHTVYIRKEAHTVLEAINRQIAHYSYHVGQIVFIAKMLKQGEWDNLSIPKRKKDM